MALETAIDEALSAAFGHGTVEYRRYSSAASLDHGSVSLSLGSEFGGGGRRNDAHEACQYLTEGKQQSIALL